MRVTGLTHASGMPVHLHRHRERVSNTQESTTQTGILYDRVAFFKVSLFKVPYVPLIPDNRTNVFEKLFLLIRERHRPLFDELVRD